MDILQTIIQGGAVGLAALALWIIWKLASNHIEHNTEVVGKLSENLVANTEVLRSLKDTIINKK